MRATIDTSSAFVEERADNYVAADENRSVDIRLHKDSAREFIDLSWHQGAKYKKSPTIRLKKGMVVRAPIKRARAWFGYFTVPTDVQAESDEAKKRDLLALYAVETERTKLAWGDYPRPRKLSEGTDPIGPHRFPDVEVRVTEWDGTQWDWLRLHKLYNLGVFDPLQFHDAKADEQAALRSENADLKAALAEMNGKINALTSMMAKAQNAAR